MKKLYGTVAVAALAAVLTTPAVAADVELPPPAADWTAFYVGIGGGGMFGFADDSTVLAFDDFNVVNHIHAAAEGFSDLGKAGAFGTVEAGFDYQMDSFVVGVLANYDFGKVKMRNKFSGVAADDFNNLAFAEGESEWKVGDTWAIGGRLGFLAADSALVYILGGYTEAKIKSSTSFSASNANNLNFATGFSDSSWEDGWFVGGGIETLLTDSISLKAEYRYADFGSVDRGDSSITGANNNVGSFSDQSADITVHSVRAVLSYRFGLGL